MAEALLVRPDRKFVESIIASGGGDLKRCMQCATCSVVCELSDGSAPFPRKEMVWAQWGLKDRLLADPDVWLCHQCNDCSKRCPRGARPGDVLAAVRRRTVEHYASPRFLADWVNRVGFLPVAFLIPIVMLTLALLARGPLGEALGFEEHPGFYAEFFPHWLLIGFYAFFTGLALIAAIVGVTRYWKAMRAADRDAGTGNAVAGVPASILRALRSILVHDRFDKCGAQHQRRLAHMGVLYGFLALFIVTIWATIDMYVNPALGIASLYPFGLMHPMKILANIGGVALVWGTVKVMVDRRHTDAGAPASTSFDWIFAWLLLGVGATGFVTEILRFTAATEPDATYTSIAYGIYFVHLVLVFQLLVYLPYSKFAHVLYRTVAMIYSEHTGRHIPGRPLTLLRPAGAGLNGAERLTARSESSEAHEALTAATR
jgi:quinone-modifying oxidoreductase subunit QmoC